MYTLEDALSTKIPDNVAPIEDANGNVAIRYYQPGKIITKCGQVTYIFVTYANICMTWVKPDDVPCILNKKGGCCGQKRPGIFTYANASTARRWTNRGGR